MGKWKILVTERLKDGKQIIKLSKDQEKKVVTTINARKRIYKEKAMYLVLNVVNEEIND